METNPEVLVADVCAHHRIAPAELAGLFVQLLMHDATMVALYEEQPEHHGDAELSAVMRLFHGITAHFQAFALGQQAAAEQHAAVDAEAADRAARRAKAMSAVVHNAVAAGRHVGATAALRTDPIG